MEWLAGQRTLHHRKGSKGDWGWKGGIAGRKRS
jgi:hypothetical protein